MRGRISESVVLGIVQSSEFMPRESDWQNLTVFLDGLVKGCMAHELLTQGIKIFEILGMTNRKFSITPIIPTLSNLLYISKPH